MREIKKSGFKEYLNDIEKQKLIENKNLKSKNRKHLKDYSALLTCFIIGVLIISLFGFIGIFHTYETESTRTHEATWGDIFAGYEGNVGDKLDNTVINYWEASKYSIFWILFGCYFLLFLVLNIIFLIKWDHLKLDDDKLRRIILIWVGVMFLICIAMEVAQFLLGSHRIFGFGALMIIPIPICAVLQFVSLKIDE